METSLGGGWRLSTRREGEPDRQLSPDAELTRSFALGCGVVFLAFLLLAALVFYFWSRS